MRAPMRSTLQCALLLALACVLPARAHDASPPTPSPDQRQAEVPLAEGGIGGLLDSGLDTIARHFIKPIPRDQLEGKALAALLESLDPYSHYLEPAEMDAFSSALDATFSGVGISFEYDDPSGYPRVAYLLRGGSAVGAGVQRGDLLLAVDGRDLKGADWGKVASVLRGPLGSPVRLRLQRAGAAEPLELEAKRVEIDTPSVRAIRRDAADRPDWWLDRASRIGYARVASIAADTANAVDTAVRELQRGHARGLVLDLRDCGGGLMQGALETADLFVERGRLLTLRERGATRVFDARHGTYTKLPIAILINGGTASSCEILAAALADNGRGTLVGERSYGKGRIQMIYSLGEGRGGMVMSTGTFQRPNGKTIDKHDVPEGSPDVGIAPQFEVKMTEGQHRAWSDYAERNAGLLLLDPSEITAPPPDPVLDKARALLEEK